MICSTFIQQSRIGRGLAVAMMVSVLLAGAAAPAWAVITDAKYTLKISEKEGALEGVSNQMLNFLMWDLGADRMINRNMPFLELKNDSTSDAPITEFRLSIGDARFHFDCSMLSACAMLAKSTPDVALASSVANSGDQLVISLGDGGLAAGEVVRFKIALGVDAANQGQFFHRPDFRTVLFDMNGKNVYDGNLLDSKTTDNAIATAKFEMTGMPSVSVNSSPFADQLVVGVEAQYYNGIYRPYGIMEPIDTFLTSGSGTGVPEPGTVVMAAVAFAGTMVVRTRVRRLVA